MGGFSVVLWLGLIVLLLYVCSRLVCFAFEVWVIAVLYGWFALGLFVSGLDCGVLCCFVLVMVAAGLVVLDFAVGCLCFVIGFGFAYCLVWFARLVYLVICVFVSFGNFGCC